MYLAASSSKSLSIWETSTNKLVSEISTDSVDCLCFSSDATKMAVSNRTENVVVYDISCLPSYSGDNMMSVSTPTTPNPANSNTGITVGNNNMVNMNVESPIANPPEIMKLAVRKETHTGPVIAISFHGHDQYMAACYRDGSCILWNLLTQEKEVEHSVHSKSIRCARFSANGDYLAVGADDDQSIRYWKIHSDAKFMELIVTTKGIPGLRSVSLCSANDKVLGFGNMDSKPGPISNKVVVYRTSTATTKSISPVTFKENRTIVNAEFSPDGSKVWSYTVEGKLRIWDLESGSLLNCVRIGISTVYHFAVSPSGDNIAVAYADGKVRVWDTHTNQQLAKMAPRCRAISFNFVAYSSDMVILM
jgi:WD40 repeat protein